MPAAVTIPTQPGSLPYAHGASRSSQVQPTASPPRWAPMPAAVTISTPPGSLPYAQKERKLHRKTGAHLQCHLGPPSCGAQWVPRQAVPVVPWSAAPWVPRQAGARQCHLGPPPCGARGPLAPRGSPSARWCPGSPTGLVAAGARGAHLALPKWPVPASCVNSQSSAPIPEGDIHICVYIYMYIYAHTRV